MDLKGFVRFIYLKKAFLKNKYSNFKNVNPTL